MCFIDQETELGEVGSAQLVSRLEARHATPKTVFFPLGRLSAWVQIDVLVS